MEKFTMSRKESQQVPIFEKLLRRELSQEAASKMLRITDRQVRNRLKSYKTNGAAGLIHKNRGRESLLKWDYKEREFSMELLRTDFKGFGPTFASEKLKNMYDISVSKETLRKEMLKDGIWIAKRKRTVYRSRRPRKLNFGKMIQVDGSPHDWFEGRAPKATLLVFIDDATSKIVWLHFANSESTRSLMKSTRDYVSTCGRPISIYVDYGSVFSVNTNNPNRDKLTQYERAMQELSIDVIHARSPQAKGRVERVNRTLQDRLIKEMRLEKISSIDEANSFIQEKYLNVHNAKFSVNPKLEQNLHRSIDDIDLSNVFCYKEKRVLQNDFVVSYKTKLLQLHKEQKTILRPKNLIVIHESLGGGLSLYIRATQLCFNEILIRPTKLITKSKSSSFPSFWKPAANHPWRNYKAKRI